jgi:CheY-like chemotaxis protein
MDLGAAAGRLARLGEEIVLNGLKVLLIDDDRDYRISVRSLLESRGCAVIEAETGRDGLRKLVEHKPDVIILDVMMECTTDGYGVNHAIKYQDAYAEFRNVPIIMVSSIEESPDELFPAAAEVEMIRPDNYLAKPLDIKKLIEVLEAAAARLASRKVGTG